MTFTNQRRQGTPIASAWNSLSDKASLPATAHRDEAYLYATTSLGFGPKIVQGGISPDRMAYVPRRQDALNPQLACAKTC